MPKVTDRIPARVIVIEMSDYEAGVLLAVCQRIGGHPNGPRGIFSDGPDSLSAQLNKYGVKQAEVNMFAEIYSPDRSLDGLKFK